MNQWIKKIWLSFYGLIPLKRELFSIIRFFYIPSERIFRHLYFKGKFNVKIDSRYSFLMQHYGSGFAMESDHFWKGAEACEPYSIKLWKKYAQESDLIFDIGANTGSYSLIAAVLNPNAVIHAFEPVQRIYTKLDYNCEMNGFTIVRHNTALSNLNGEIFICDEKGHNEYTAHVVQEENSNTYRVLSQRLDYYTEALFNAGKVLFKLDVERHESQVLQGMGELLKKIRPVILLEVLDEESAQLVRPFFEDLDYVFLNIDEIKGYTQISTIQKSYGNNIFCCPKEKYLQDS
jgi:FkbM family methyltransferase